MRFILVFILSMPWWYLSSARVQSPPILTVYTYQSFASEYGLGPAIAAAFNAQCHCQLKFELAVDGVVLLNRLRMQREKLPADVVIGLDNNLLETAQQTGLFAESGVDTSHIGVPTDWHNRFFIPYTYSWFGFVYDKNRLKKPPTSLRELVDSNTQWRIIYADPRTSTVGVGLLLWMHHVFGEKTAQAWQKLAHKTVTVTRGWGEAYSLFLKGESDFVLSYTTSPAWHQLVEKRDNYASAAFREGHYLQVEVAGILKNSQHPELARQFLHFILSPTVQRLIAEKNGTLPVIDVALPAAFAAAPRPAKSLQYSAHQVAEARTQWTKQWQQAVSQ